jgi:PAS domain S-box-containing protein
LLFDVYVVFQQLQIHRIRRRLLDHEEMFRLITENAADMIAVVSADGQRLYNSPSYYKVLGYTAEDLIASSAFEQIHPEDQQRVRQASEEARTRGVGRRIEYRVRHKDGSWRNLESTASTIRNAAGKVDKLVIVNRDITDRKRLEEQFRQSQKMEAVGRLSGGIAHDFNNLLGVMIGFCEILQEQVMQDPVLSDSVSEILKAGNKAAALTRQLLAFSRQQVLEPTVLELNRTISEIEKMLNRIIGEDIELATTLDSTLRRVKADEGQIEQVILNLAVNARDAMPDGGKLLIETKNIQIDERFAASFPYPVKAGAYVLLSVSDSGMGMDSTTQAHMFEPFFTTKEKGKGTGLGLATVYGIVKQSGGYIDVASELGRGTTFKIYLPRVDQEATPQIRKTQDRQFTGTGKTLLIVEDEESLLKATCRLLEGFGYNLLQATCGADALRISEHYSHKIDLILADVVMPGMSGPELIEQLKEKRPDIKVVYMSGYTGQAVGRSEVFSPNAPFLLKPFSRADLGKKLSAALDGEEIENPPLLHA